MDLNLLKFSFRNETWAFAVPVGFMVFDIFTGFINAWRKRKVKSSIMRNGLAKKAGEMCLLLIGLMLIRGTLAPPYILTFFAWYICIMEAVSIMENLDKLGVPIPKWVKKAIGTINDSIQNGDPIKGDDTDGGTNRKHK